MSSDVEEDRGSNKSVKDFFASVGEGDLFCSDQSITMYGSDAALEGSSREATNNANPAVVDIIAGLMGWNRRS